MSRRFSKKKSNNYFEHDDRDDQFPQVKTGSVRRVSFKNNQPRENNGRAGFDRKMRNWHEAASRFLEDDDIVMSQTEQQKRRGSYAPVTNFSRMRILPKNFSWYRVLVVRGAKMEKNTLFKMLLALINPVPLIPCCYKHEGQDAVFFVGQYNSASALKNASGKMVSYDGQKIILKVTPGSPQITLLPAEKEKIKRAMARRYNPAMKALDFSKLYDDTELRADDCFVLLSVSNVLINVIKIIGETIPDLYALDLSDNKMFCFQPNSMKEDLPNLRILHLANNKFNHIHNLKALKNLPIEELVLKGNPFLSKIKDHNSYVKDAQRLFPKLIKLDGVDIPPLITFDTVSPSKLLPQQASFLCSMEGEAVVKPFIHQYFEIFDSDNRAPLIEAYEENAQFSMSCFLPFPSVKDKNQLFSHGNPDDYTSLSRNLCKIKPLHVRKQKLQVGRNNIMKCLHSLPKTQHDPSSFTVDLTIFTPQLLMLSLSGVFRERPVNAVPVIRSFSRTFIIVPVNSGFCIINELLFVGIPTVAQAKTAFTAVASIPSAPVLSPVVQSPVVQSPVVQSPILQSPVGSAASSSAANLDIATKQQMVTALAALTGMNLMWSEKCLVETNWDYDQGLLAFNNLKARGVVPAEAFMK